MIIRYIVSTINSRVVLDVDDAFNLDVGEVLYLCSSLHKAKVPYIQKYEIINIVEEAIVKYPKKIKVVEQVPEMEHISHCENNLLYDVNVPQKQVNKPKIKFSETKWGKRLDELSFYLLVFGTVIGFMLWVGALGKQL